MPEQHKAEGLHVLPNPVFEGSEKRIEIDFAPRGDACAPACGLRALDRSALDQLMTLAACCIVSSRSNDAFDAYVLSESSLFVYPTKWILKTCGTTRLLNSVPRLLELAATIGMQPVRVKFSRATFLFPDQQVRRSCWMRRRAVGRPREHDMQLMAHRCAVNPQQIMAGFACQRSQPCMTSSRCNPMHSYYHIAILPSLFSGMRSAGAKSCSWAHHCHANAAQHSIRPRTSNKLPPVATQHFPHTSFDDEVEFLDAHFAAVIGATGRAYVLGDPSEVRPRQNIVAELIVVLVGELPLHVDSLSV